MTDLCAACTFSHLPGTFAPDNQWHPAWDAATPRPQAVLSTPDGGASFVAFLSPDLPNLALPALVEALTRLAVEFRAGDRTAWSEPDDGYSQVPLVSFYDAVPAARSMAG